MAFTIDPRALAQLQAVIASDPTLGGSLPGGATESFFAKYDTLGVGFGTPEVPEELGDPMILRDVGDVGGGTNGEVLPSAHVPIPPVVPVQEPFVAELQLQPGDDLRDLPGVQAPGVAGLPVVAGAGVLVQLALRIIRSAMGGATRVTAAHWNSLPAWARTALTAVGIGVGVDLALDIPGVPGESLILPGGGDAAHFPTHMIDGHLGAHVVGGWVANGVQFYRLSDGKLAVQNKLGRWKVWRPKKPIVIMPGGANNLRTLLRADAVLNRQAKKIATMLNRRAPRGPRRKPGQKDGVVIIQNDGKTATT